MSILARVTPSMDEKHILPVGFCLVGHTDWAGRYGDLIEAHWKDTKDLKIDQLIDELADPWFKFRRKYEDAYQKYGEGKRLPTPHAIFSQWLPAQQPSELTFTDLYDDIPNETRRAA
jgi:hypothetical protein